MEDLESCLRNGRGFKTNAEDVLSRLPDQCNEAREGTMVALKYPDGNWYIGRLRYSGARLPSLGFAGDGHWMELRSAIKVVRI